MAVKTLHLRVELPDADPYVIRIINADMVAWDRTRIKHKWPDQKEVPSLWMTFVAWRAARREGHTDITYEKWEETVIDLDPVDAEGNPLSDDDEAEDVDPTQPDPVRISSVG